jgi:hypothetical protein
LHELARDPRYSGNAHLLRSLKTAEEIHSGALDNQRRMKQALALRAKYLGGTTITAPKYVQPNADIVTQPPPFPMVAKIGIPCIAILALWWLWHEWKKGVS